MLGHGREVHRYDHSVRSGHGWCPLGAYGKKPATQSSLFGELVNEERTVRVAYSEERIHEAVVRVAEAINLDFAGQHVHLIGVLKGSFLFLADLVRHLRVPCSVDFVRLSSYGSGISSSGTAREVISLADPVAGRHVVVVEEIVDSGQTLAKLLRDLLDAGAASVRVCTLVDKTGRRQVEVPVHYRGFSIEDGFLIGYGLDMDEKYRNLPAIYMMEESPEAKEL
jgi:hypoxanthine phosphoribosyltransferase